MMWIILLVLFITLSPGVLFTLPGFGKKMGGKVVIALMHAALFVVVVNLFSVVEGFQRIAKPGVGGRQSPEVQLRNAENALLSTQRRLESSQRAVIDLNQRIANAEASLAQGTAQVELINERMESQKAVDAKAMAQASDQEKQARRALTEAKNSLTKTTSNIESSKRGITTVTATIERIKAVLARQEGERAAAVAAAVAAAAAAQAPAEAIAGSS